MEKRPLPGRLAKERYEQNMLMSENTELHSIEVCIIEIYICERNEVMSENSEPQVKEIEAMFAVL